MWGKCDEQQLFISLMCPFVCVNLKLTQEKDGNIDIQKSLFNVLKMEPVVSRVYSHLKVKTSLS